MQGEAGDSGATVADGALVVVVDGIAVVVVVDVVGAEVVVVVDEAVDGAAVVGTGASVGVDAVVSPSMIVSCFIPLLKTVRIGNAPRPHSPLKSSVSIDQTMAPPNLLLRI